MGSLYSIKCDHAQVSELRLLMISLRVMESEIDQEDDLESLLAARAACIDGVDDWVNRVLSKNVSPLQLERIREGMWDAYLLLGPGGCNLRVLWKPERELFDWHATDSWDHTRGLDALRALSEKGVNQVYTQHLV